MRKVLQVLAVSALLVMGMALGAQAQNLLVNGGFETGDYTGWNSGGCGPFGVTTGGAGWGPHSGSYFSLEGAVGCDHEINQAFHDVAGQALTVSFYYGSDGGTPNDIYVLWDGGGIYSSSNDPSTLPNYRHYTFQVTGTGIDALSIGVRNDPSWQALDDVFVGTPEPGTLVMFGSGVLGLAGVIRRKLDV
jgi:PEP-CTERM motif